MENRKRSIRLTLQRNLSLFSLLLTKFVDYVTLKYVLIMPIILHRLVLYLSVISSVVVSAVATALFAIIVHASRRSVG